MSLGLDTSVALRLLTGDPPDQAEAARALLATVTAPAAISDLVIAETYFALRHHYSVPHTDAVRELHALVTDPRVRTSGVARAVLAQAPSRGSSKSAQPGLVDRLVHADYTREQLQLVTFDRELARFEGARLLMASSP